tara:strand:+ start:707 stop:922 length:216 start_codon:yes stop_codon:yes gene_type:complete
MIVRIIIAFICSLIWNVREYKKLKETYEKNPLAEKPELFPCILATAFMALFFYLPITLIYWAILYFDGYLD